jgi:lysozyme
MTDSVTNQIMVDEERRLQVYDDATGKPIVAGSHVIGNPTIGYGTLLSAPGGITVDEAEAMLDARIATARASAQTLPVYGRLNNARQDVLVQLCFQMGVAGVRGFKQMLSALADCDFDRAGDELIDSKLHEQAPARCERLADVLRSGHA